MTTVVILVAIAVYFGIGCLLYAYSSARSGETAEKIQFDAMLICCVTWPYLALLSIGYWLGEERGKGKGGKGSDQRDSDGYK